MGPTVTLRPSSPAERELRFAIIEAAWRGAYTHIYTPDEIDAVFAGKIATFGDWVDDRIRTYGYTHAEVDGESIGLVGVGARFPATADEADDEAMPEDGEITSLYVLPEWQGRGIGVMLWRHGLAQLRDEYRHSAAWVYTLARAPAAAWYEAHGCRVRDQSIYGVGKHEERALGYWLTL